MLRALNIVIRRLDQPQEDIFYILADIARLCERCRIRNGKRHVKNPGQRLRKHRFANACGAQEQNIALLDFHIRTLAEINAFIVVINSHAQRDFCLLLPDHIFVELIFQLLRRGKGKIRVVPPTVAVRAVLILNDLPAKLHTLVADENARPCDQRIHLILRFIAEGAAYTLLTVVIISWHSCNTSPVKAITCAQ